jgi:hypothetical protein
LIGNNIATIKITLTQNAIVIFITKISIAFCNYKLLNLLPMTINFKNLFIFLIILIIEILIALYIKGGFIRHVFGDYLVVLMLYYFFRSFIKLKPIYTALLTLCIAYIIEFLQFINIIEILNIKQHTVTTLILGTTFSIHDLIAYTLGFLTIIFIEKINTFSTS